MMERKLLKSQLTQSTASFVRSGLMKKTRKRLITKEGMNITLKIVCISDVPTASMAYLGMFAR